MAIGYPSGNYANDMNSLYNVTLDLSGWDRVTIQCVPPMAGSFYVYGSLDGGFSLGSEQGDAKLAQNFNPIQATNLATGTATGVISSPGNYKVDINAQYLRLQGSPAGAGTSVYKLLFFNSKIG